MKFLDKGSYLIKRNECLLFTGEDKAKANVVIASVKRAVVTVRDLAVTSLEVPTAAAQHVESGIFIVFIFTPFQYVSGHVMNC